tara:strand:+ start:1077 stop:1286 length:210 start_codon:yes stop_codon:yes gene_type:complete
MDKAIDKLFTALDVFMRVYAPMIMLLIWTTLTFSHFLRGLNWMPLLFIFPPLIMMAVSALKEWRDIEES